MTRPAREPCPAVPLSPAALSLGVPLLGVPLRGALLLGVLLLGACAPERQQFRPQETGAAATGGGTTVDTGATRASGSPEEQLQQLDGALREQGFAPIGDAVRGSLREGGLIAYPIDAVAGRCYTAAVLGEEPGQNLDVVVLDPLGREAAHDVQPDAHPWASFCAAQEGRFIVRLQMAAGAGSYLYAAYEGPADRRVALNAFYGEAVEAGPATASLDGPTSARLGALDQRLQPEGYRRVAEPTGLVLDAGDAREYRLSLVEGQCYAFAALGGPGTSDPQLALVDASGARLAAETAAGQDAFLTHCAEGTGAYALQVLLAGGRGPVFTVGYLRSGGDVATAQTPVISDRTTRAADLDESFALLDADMRARGYERYGDEARGDLRAGQVQRYPVSLEGGRCYAILAVGATTVSDLDLVLYDTSGQPVDEDRSGDARAIVRVCPPATGAYTMEVRLSAGNGAYVYAPYRWPRGIQGPFGLAGLSYVRLAEVTALLSVEGYTPDPGFTPGSGTLGAEGDSGTASLTLEGGECYAIVVVGGEGVRDLDLLLTRAAGTVATDGGSRNAFPNVRRCVEVTGPYTLVVRAARGQGTYHYQVFRRP
ncbi:MAG: hypothetical protein ACFCGT_26610 [Sandaracinaceae bacterium]